MRLEREDNFDFLRIISTIAVISMHVSSRYIDAITSQKIFGYFYLNHIEISCLYGVAGCFAVPCFVMLSGAFDLANNKNMEYKYFYKKILKKIGIPTLIFSMGYFLYSLIRSIYIGKITGGGYLELFNPVKNLIVGKPFYHMWYLSMMTGVFLLVPMVLKLKNDINEKTFDKIAWIFLVFASFSVWTSSFKLFWSIGYSFSFLGYFMMGDVLRRKMFSKKSNIKGVLLILGGVMVLLVINYLKFNQLIRGVTDSDLRHIFTGPYSPFVVISSILIFAGVSALSIKKNLSNCASQTFYIYLFHAGIWDIVCRVIHFKWDNRIVIPVSIITVFVLSYIAAKIYTNLWDKIDNKYNVSEQICGIIKL